MKRKARCIRRNKCWWVSKLMAGALLLSISSMLTAQEPARDFRTVDSLSVKYYLSGEWDSLITLGKGSGYDYYWLNFRMGYAWYAQGKYTRALQQFKKTLRNNAADPLTLEYYNYAALAMGFNEQALAAAGEFRPQAPERIAANPPYPLTGVGAGYLSSSAAQSLTSANLDQDPNIYGESALPGSGNFYFGYHSFPLLPRLLLTPGVSYLKTTNPFRAFTADTLLFSSENPYQEKNIHVSISWVPSLSWTIQSYFRLSGMKYDLKQVTYNPSSGQYGLSTIHQKNTDRAGGISLTKYCGDFSLKADATWHSEYDSAFSQVGLNVNWYILSDTRLIMGAGVFAGLGQRDKRTAWIQRVSFSPLKNLWLTGTLTLGHIAHKSFDDAWIIYNADSQISRITTLNVFMLLGSRLSASLQWSNLRCKGYGLYFQPTLEPALQDMSYQKNTVSLSVFWKW
ncbi:MAG: tetratricopeptide repeat protein [Bacteroidales bacterium]